MTRLLLVVAVVMFSGCTSRPDQGQPAKKAHHDEAGDVRSGQPATRAKTSGASEQLTPADLERVNAFMAQITRAFEVADPNLLQELEHPGYDPRGVENALKFNKTLMEGGDKVQSWSARSYSQPDWEIMEYKRYHPEPSVWIEVTLHNGKRPYALAFACAPDKGGILRSCYYVDR